MSNIAVLEQHQVDHFTTDQVELIKRTVCLNSTDDELKLFLHVAKKSKLDPFARQIHAVKRFTKNGEVMSIQVGIDGYRLIAHRTGACAGISDATFAYKTDINGKPIRVIESATVVVKKVVAGNICEFAATAYWDEYAPHYYDRNKGTEMLSPMWRQRPKGQLAKCAEALALRKAFPNELSGLYTEEEMQRADMEAEKEEEMVTRPDVDYRKREQQIETINLLMGKICEGMTLQEKGATMLEVLKVGNFKELKTKNNGELDLLIQKLEGKLKGGVQ